MEVIGVKRRKTISEFPVVMQEPSNSNQELTRVLKSCTRCRQQKIKCDSIERKPLGCSHCERKGVECVPEYVSAPIKRSGDVVERLTSEVLQLKKVLDGMIDRKSKLIEVLASRGIQFPKDLQFNIESMPSPTSEFSGDEDEVYEEQEDEDEDDYEYNDHYYYDEQIDSELEQEELNSHGFQESPEQVGKRGPQTPNIDIRGVEGSYGKIYTSSNVTIPLENGKVTATTTIQLPPTPSHSTLSDDDTSAFTLDSLSFTLTEIEAIFDNFRENFHNFVPIFPREFLYDPALVFSESDLLFWSIVGISHLNKDSEKFAKLADSIKSLVVEKCWYNTPRSVHTLLALLLLTTWSLPNKGDEISLTYISLMRSLSLQLGLHRSEFIDEFSHKTTVGISKFSSDNNTILRERIYKFIAITSNYWYSFLGLPQNNEEDYIVDKACRSLLKKETTLASEDQYINSLLKLSMIQSKISATLESSDTSITRLYRINQSKRFINLGMFDRILSDSSNSINLGNSNLTQLGIEYCRLQVFLYAFFPLDKYKTDENLSVEEYQSNIYKAMKSCYLIIELATKEFKGNFYQIPVYYRFAIELSLLVIMRIFHSPLLRSRSEYDTLKNCFKKGYELFRCSNDWEGTNLQDCSKVEFILKKFDKAMLENKDLIILGSMKENKQGNRFFLIKRFKDHLVFSLQREMSWFIHECSKGTTTNRVLKWENYGFSKSVTDGIGQSIFE